MTPPVYSYHIFRPSPGLSPSDQVKDCIVQLEAFVTHCEADDLIVRVNWFFALSERLNCGVVRNWLGESDFLQRIKISPTFIAQRPIGDVDNEVLVVCVQGVKKAARRYGEIADIGYVVVQRENEQWLYAGGSECVSTTLSCRMQTRNTFSLIRDILAQEGFGFVDIVRQWNYIGDILEQEIGPLGLIQNYQEFNEERAEWYLQNGLSQDFPAATGIGTMGGGVRIEIVALKSRQQIQVASLSSNLQEDAHRYPDSALVGSVKKNPPMFERGKMVLHPRGGHIWISGTAAIRGDKSVQGTALDQLKVACENIHQLIRQDHLSEWAVDPGRKAVNPVYVRGYVKHLSDGKAVLRYLEQEFPGAAIHVFQADICRDDLLVETEAEFSVL